jgi:A/G-specific adenine glycosylase
MCLQIIIRHIQIFLQGYMKKITQKSFFSKKLALWHKNDNFRPLPWKDEKNPYKVWLSEIILQQTRVEQGLDYYNKFIIKYPTIEKLAAANDKDVFKLWEGLGYYSRCRNLLATARVVAFENEGVFPNTYNSIVQLKGIGPYTAAAIASFAFNLPHAVVDGNVFRVLARYFNINTAIDSTEGKKEFTLLANELLDKKLPAKFNQAIMDFGATICKPKLPLCSICPLQQECVSSAKNTVSILPVKSKKLIKKNRFFYYIIANYNNKIYIKQREEKDIWQNLWEFILIEKDSLVDIDSLISSNEFIGIVGKKPTIEKISLVQKQQLTHQKIEGIFIHVSLRRAIKDERYIAMSKNEFDKVAFPRFITQYFETVNKP